MTLFGQLTIATALLQYRKRISYLALRQEFDLSERGLEALIKELAEVDHVAADENGEFLVWSEPTVAASSKSGLPESHRYLDDVEHHQEADGETETASEETDVSSPPFTAQDNDAERRPLTVMFCDLVGSTALSTEMDPEDLRKVIQLYQQTCTDVLVRYDGYVAKYMGDGILIYFGYPRAHEGDARRSVYAALAIVRAVGKLNESHASALDTELAVRIGIATGLVVVGDLIGAGLSQERNVVGKTPNLAARLQGVAAPNQVVIADETRALVCDTFECEDLGSHDLKGIAEPVRAWRAVAERSADPNEEAVEQSEPLVGRHEELELLLRAWEQSRGGQGRIVTLCGDAGLGKSRLAEAVGSRVKDDGGFKILFRCSPYHTGNAFYPIIVHLQSTLGWLRDDDDDTKLAKLTRKLDIYRLPKAETVPLLANLLSLPLQEGQFKPLDASNEKHRQRTLDTIVSMILEDAERRPVFQVWENLECADPSTLELLEQFIERSETSPLMNLLIYRPEFTPTWQQRSTINPLTLSRLDRRDIEAVVSRETGGMALPEVLVSQIVDKADGVPLYARELTKMIILSDLVREADGRYELTQSAGDVTIPATLQESLMARLDGLGSAKNLAQLGAAIGDQFSPELLQAIATEEVGTIRQALDSLVDADLLARRRQGAHLTYRFRQGLIRDVAYESLLRQRRESLHGAIAEAIEALEDTETEEHTAILAYHYGRSCYLDRAINFTLRAGDHAARLHARTEASGYYSQALATADRLDDTPELQRAKIDAMLKLASVSSSRGDLERDQENLTRAQEMAESLADQLRLAQIFYRFGRLHYARGDGKTAASYSEKSLTIADRLGDEALAAPAINLLGRYYTLQGNVGRGSDMLVRNVEQMHDVGNAVEEATAAGFAGMAFGWRGKFEKGISYASRSLELATRTEDPFALSAAYNYRGAVYLQRGEWASAIADLEKGRQIAEECGDSFRSYILKAYESEAQIESNRPALACELLDEAMAFAKEIGTRFQLGVATRNYAAAMLRFGKIDSAVVACAEAIQIAEEANELLVKSRACRLLVDVWCRFDRIDRHEAEQMINEAIRIQRDFGAEPELARSQLTYARLLGGHGKHDEAEEYVRLATDMFRHLGMDWDLAQAEQRFHQLESYQCREAEPN